MALVTGAGTGIGRGCAVLLAKEGAAVVVANRSRESGEATAAQIRGAGGRAAYCRTDVSEEEDCSAAVKFAVDTFGRLDILVNNAGIFPRAGIAETDGPLWGAIMDTNLRGPFNLCKSAVPVMLSQGGGSIINMGSIHGLGGSGNLIAYAISKGGLLTLTRNLARSYVRQNIRANYVIPGWVISEGEVAVQALEGHDAAWLSEAGNRLSTGRHQTPEDAAYAVLYLASDESSQVTGGILSTDGGMAQLSSWV